MGCSSSSPSNVDLNPMVLNTTSSKTEIVKSQDIETVKSQDIIQIMKKEASNLNLDYENMTEEEIMAIEMGNLSFFKKLSAVDTTRDYTIIVDSSASMFNGSGVNNLWKQTKDALIFIANSAVKCDPDGITLHFFSDIFTTHSNIKTGEEVMKQFDDPINQLCLTTNLAIVLKEALKPDNIPRLKPETILIITDGAPDSEKAVEKEIIYATHNYMKDNNDLSITIVQVGIDEMATKWLQKLDDGLVKLGAKYDIVDVLSAKDLCKFDFATIIEKSIRD